MVAFIEASPLRYALTFKPTVYVSHIRQFWSTTRIETTEEGIKILATVDGILRTVTESSLRRNIKLQDEVGISFLPDTEFFENLTLVGYNISPNQKFTFQKGLFSHQWKYLIYTIMQCLSPKSTGFNEFSSNIATALVCLATNRTYNFSKMIFDGQVKCKIHVKYRSFYNIRAESPYDTKWAKMAQGKNGLPKVHLRPPPPPMGDIYPLLALERVSSYFGFSFTYLYFNLSKDETSDILKKFITEIENLKDYKVKIIRCDNGGEFKNKEINDFCSQKGIKREFSNARTPQQNGVAERRNRTLIEAARTMLADAKLPVTFWAEAVNG
nr:ribonuclease H-like domain-containing protein [Tanacetum cinerariifolium]